MSGVKKLLSLLWFPASYSSKNTSGGTQLLQGLLWFAEKTIEQTTQHWTLALKTIELRDTKVQWN